MRKAETLISGSAGLKPASDKKKIGSPQPEAVGDAQPELDNFDLLTNTDLTATVGAFKGRIQRKKKEQEQTDDAKREAANIRHKVMLESMMNIRKSLAEVARIELGDRFMFELEADDWHGWPRVSIKLDDTFDPIAEYPSFQVLAHDRNDRGTLEIHYGSDKQHPERVVLARPGEIKKLPAVLKKCVRSYLDLVGDIVLDAERESAEDIEEAALNASGAEVQAEIEKNSADTLSGDLFEEDYEEAILDSLPSLEELDSLEVSGFEKEEEAAAASK